MAVSVNIYIHRVEEEKDGRADGFGDRCRIDRTRTVHSQLSTVHAEEQCYEPLRAPESVRKKTFDLFQVEEVYVRERVNGQQGRKSLCIGSLRVVFVDSNAQLRGVKHQ